MSLHLYPFLYLILKNTLIQLSGSLDEAAAVHGGGVFYRLRRITIPLLLSSYAMGALLVFVKTLSEFGTPITMGRRVGFPVLVTEIYRYTSNWPLNFPRAAGYSVFLVAICLMIWGVQTYISRKNAFQLVGGKGTRRKAVFPGRVSTIVSWGYLVFLLSSSIGIPYFSIILTSLMKLRSRGISFANLTLEHYQAILVPNSPGLRALGWSLVLSFAAATLAAILGTWAGLSAYRQKNESRSLGTVAGGTSDFLALMPNTVPSIVVVVGLILMWNAVWMPLRIYNTPLMLVVSYTVLFLPFTVQYVKSSREKISQSLLTAGRVSGAGQAYVFLKITLPLITRGILAGWIMTFAISFRELVGSLIIRPPSIHTTATFIYGQFEQGSVSQGMAMALISVGVTSVVLILVQRWSLGKE